MEDVNVDALLDAADIARKRAKEEPVACGHTARGACGEVFTCTLTEGHKGLHAERVRLRDGVSVTNWGDDGLAPHATRGMTR